jgi:hypothetical protein
VTQSIAPKTGLNALLTPEESVLTLIRSPALPVRQPAQPRADDDREQRRRARQGGEAVDFKVRAKPAHSEAPPDTPLLWVIREELKQAR